MQKIIVKRDIYNSQGVLIIGKDTCIQLTESMKIRLEKIGVLSKILSEEKINNTTEGIEKKEFQNNVTRFKKKHSLLNNKLLNDSIEIVQNIVFNSKEEKWHLHLHSLINSNELLYSHALDTALITALIGAKLKYNKKNLNDLVLGAIFHDIGLVLTPANVIKKGDDLTIEERLIYKNHCKLGYSMVAKVIESPIVKNIILQHHERLDGSGYPHQLKGNEIDKHAQIVMVADAFDSATMYTPYKKTKDPKTVLKEMLEEKEKFPEKIVKCLVDLMD